MANIRSTNVIGLGSMKFQRAGQRWQPCHEAMIDDCPPEPVSQEPDPSCDKLDIMFVFPEGTSALYYPSQFVNTLENFADYVAANTTDYQLGCVVAQDSGAVSVIESLSLNNIASFKSSLSSLSAQTYSLAKNIDGAMESAVDGTAGTWRSSATVRKYIFYVGNSLPGGTDDTYSGADETAFLQAVLDGQNNDDITTSVIELRAMNLSQPSTADQAEIDRIHALAANNGQGRYVKHGPTTPLLATMLLVLDSLCYTDGGFEGDGYENTSHLLCCRTRVCKICLTFEEYGEDPQYGTAEWNNDEGAYIGSIAGASFRGYWAVRTKCYFFVEIDDVIEGAFIQCPEYDEDSTGCRNPGGVIEDLTIGEGYSAITGTLTFETYEPKRLRRNEGTLPGECHADVAVLLDSNWRNTPGVEDLQGTELQPMIDYLAANFDSYRLALVKFSVGISSHTLVTDFSLNNGSAFLTDLNAIVPSGGSAPTVDDHRRSDGAMAIAVNDLTWRPGAKKKIILLNQGRPGDATPVADDNAYELSQLNVAGSAPSSGITVDCLSLPYVNSGYEISFSYGPGVQRINLETANAGSGAHVSVTALDGAADYNDGVNVLAPAVIARVEAMNCTDGDGACASHFCGNSDCTCEDLCIDITVTDAGELQCRAAGTVPWADTDTCELGTDSPRWEGTVACDGLESDTFSVEIFLKKNDYGDCVVYGEINGYVFSASLEETPVVPEDMSASWTIESGYLVIEVDISCLVCGECGKVTVDCCSNPIPRTLYADVDTTTPSPGPNPDDCSCATGTYTLRYTEGSGLAGGQYAHWTSDSVVWNCPNPAYDAIVLELRCLTSVWHINLYLLLDGEVKFSSSSSSPDPSSTCDPFEQLFEEKAYFAGGCQPGLVPDLQTITVVE